MMGYLFQGDSGLFIGISMPDLAADYTNRKVLFYQY